MYVDEWDAMAKSRKRKKRPSVKSNTLKPTKPIQPVQSDPAVLNLLNTGLSFQNSGNFSEAEKCYRQVLDLQPENPVAYHLIGLMANKLGKSDIAIDLISRAVSFFPNYMDAHYNLGTVFQGLGRNDEAIASYSKAVSLNPSYLDARNNLGNVYLAQGRSQEAIACFEKVLKQNPDYQGAYVNLATAYSSLERYDEAIASLEKVISLNPNLAEAHNNLGTTLDDLGRDAEALAAYNRAIEINPGYVEAIFSLGFLQMKLGKMDEARAAFRKAIAIRPGFAMAHRLLAFMKKHETHDDEMRVMEHIFSNPNCTDDQKMNVAFGLGKAYAEIGEHKKSFEYYLAGNDLRRKEVAYSTTQETQRFERICQFFNKDYCAGYDTASDMGKGQIFILGMPRSGTTLVEQILASHSEVYGAGEQSYIQKICKEIENRTGRSYPESLSEIEDSDFLELGENYINRLRRYSPDSPFITDKMPANFQYIGFIKKALPAAKIVHVTRNPVDTCFSIFTTFFQGSIPYSYNQRELGEYYCLYKALMSHWHTVLPGVIHDISYETLLDEPEAETRRLLDYCGLTFEDACLNFHTTKRTVRTASAQQVRMPIYKSSVERWRHNEAQLSDLIEALKSC